jgi:DivIVA domain-containing protein
LTGPSLYATHKPTVLVILGLMASGDAANPPVNDSSPNGGGSERQSLPSAIEDVAFPVSIRGYDREAVDGYVNRVRDVVMQLEKSQSPEAAVKQALEKVGEQTKGILEHAGETAEEITVAARQEAKETNARAKGEAKDIVAKAKAESTESLARSKAEADATVAQARQEAAAHLQRSREEVAALREEAEARLRKLHADTESIRQDRSQLLDEIREFATRVEEVATAADTRFPQRDAAGTGDDETRDSEAADQTDAGLTADTRQNAPS